MHFMNGCAHVAHLHLSAPSGGWPHASSNAREADAQHYSAATAGGSIVERPFSVSASEVVSRRVVYELELVSGLAARLGRSCCWQGRQTDERIIAHRRDCFQRHVA